MKPHCFCFTVLFSLLTTPIFAVGWEKQAIEDAKQDKVILAFDGVIPNRMVCDTVPRVLPDGRIALYFLAGGNKEPLPDNYIGVVYSSDDGDTWSKLESVDVGFPRSGNTIGHQAMFVKAKLPPLGGIPQPVDNAKDAAPLIPPQDVVKPVEQSNLLDPKIRDMALQTPVLNTSPGPEYWDENRDYNMTLGMDRSPGGRLWSAWVSGGDSDKGYFVIASSDDEGKTWSKPRLIIDPTNAPNGLRRRVLVGNLWTDPTGKLWLFFDQSMGYYDGRAGDWATVCDDPDAENPAWSKPVRIWHGATLCKPTVLSTGEWLLPISLWERGMIGPKDRLGEEHRNLDLLRGANLFASTDQGKTWNRHGRCRFPLENHSFDEHMVIERKDGSLWMLARTTKGMMQSFSTDRGRLWSEPTEAFPHIAARFFIRRLQSGNILFVRHGAMDETTKSRSHLTAFLSDDDGKTWKGGLVLDDRNGISYPDGFQHPDGRIFIQYDRGRGGEAEILFATFSEADVLAGKPVAETTGLRQLVSKAMGKKK